MHINGGRGADGHRSSAAISSSPACGAVRRGTNPNTAVPAIAPMPAMAMNQTARAAVASVGPCAAVTPMSTSAIATSATPRTSIDSRAAVTPMSSVAAVPPGITAVATVVAVTPMPAQRATITPVAYLILRARRSVIREAVANEEAGVRFLSCAVAIQQIDTGCGFIGNALDDLIDTP